MYQLNDKGSWLSYLFINIFHCFLQQNSTKSQEQNDHEEHYTGTKHHLLCVCVCRDKFLTHISARHRNTDKYAGADLGGAAPSKILR